MSVLQHMVAIVYRLSHQKRFFSCRWSVFCVFPMDGLCSIPTLESERKSYASATEFNCSKTSLPVIKVSIRFFLNYFFPVNDLFLYFHVSLQ